MVSVRTIRDDELETWFTAVSTSFLEVEDGRAVAEHLRPYYDLARVWAAFEGGRIVGTFRTFGSELTLPGGVAVPGSAVAAVTVHPVYRRRGVLRQLAAAEHAAMRDRGDVVAMLHASEYGIYGKIGYGPATEDATWTVELPATAVVGTWSREAIELVPADPAASAILGTVYEGHRRRQPGEIKRRDHHSDLALGLIEFPWQRRWKGLVAVHRAPTGEADGYVRFTVKEEEGGRLPRATLTVDELHALSDETASALWRFVLTLDLVTTVRATHRRVRERFPWLLTDRRAAAMSDVGDDLWVRVVDLAAALGARGYERSGGLVLETVEDLGGGEARRTRVRLDASPDGATARETADAADLVVDHGALGAALLGGTRLRDAVLAHGWDEHRAGALDLADGLLRTADAPWSTTFF